MTTTDGDALPDGLRPQSVMFSFLGIYVLGSGVLVSTGSVIDVMSRVGVSEEASRTTLARMARRGLLERHRRGRQAYVGLTPRAVDVLEDGRRRVWERGAVDVAWDGSWSLVGFSLPEERRAERNAFRARLVWEGFGMLQHGLWIAPGRRDLDVVLGPLAGDRQVTTMTSRSAGVTDDRELLERAFDLDGIARRYASFVRRWERDAVVPGLSDDLARQLVLHTDWLQVVRETPRLPAPLLPQQPVAGQAERLFRTLAAAYEASAAVVAAELLDVVEPTAAGE
ncbi:PaaX family transcriptional regulator [Mumia sp. DW29H23]|uniref:PaaX family transcriptional regulator n=1 Tax=Mumia sp. DW29H23 TaxID=3421241 RepID=UPI003D687777